MWQCVRSNEVDGAHSACDIRSHVTDAVDFASLSSSSPSSSSSSKLCRARVWRCALLTQLLPDPGAGRLDQTRWLRGSFTSRYVWDVSAARCASPRERWQEFPDANSQVVLKPPRGIDVSLEGDVSVRLDAECDRRFPLFVLYLLNFYVIKRWFLIKNARYKRGVKKTERDEGVGGWKRITPFLQSRRDIHFSLTCFKRVKNVFGI